MSFKTNQYQQITLQDSFMIQTARTQQIILKSWVYDFANIVFPAINEERFAVLYNDNPASRPNTPVNIIIGALILKENNGLSDDELFESICCDARFQYALHTTSFTEQPVSDRTFSRFRKRLYDYEKETGKNLLEEEMTSLAAAYQKYMNLNSNIRRMDSLMVSSRCKRMSRLEIVYQTTANAVRLIHRLGKDDILTPELFHYVDSDDYNQTIYYCKADDVDLQLKKVLNDAVSVQQIMKDDEWHEFNEYQLLTRVINEQSASSDDDEGTLIPKEKKDIPSNSLQNPSDPDATFCRKAGKNHVGYKGNITETVGENGDSLITAASYDVNIRSDIDFCKEYLSKKTDNANQETLIADGAYGGRKSFSLAREKNTNLVTTALNGKCPDTFLADFNLSEDGTNVITCPMGHEPVSCSFYSNIGICRARFMKSHCGNCPHNGACNPKEQKNTYFVDISSTMVARAAYLKKLATKEYQIFRRKRNAVEGIMSVLRRRYHVDQIPTYGLIRSRQFFMLKVCAYNFNKLRRYCRRVGIKPAQTQVII